MFHLMAWLRWFAPLAGRKLVGNEAIAPQSFKLIQMILQGNPSGSNRWLQGNRIKNLAFSM
jgi:hypothetical protein